MKKIKKVRTRRKMTSAEFWLLWVAMPLLVSAMASIVIILVLLAM